MSTEVRIRVAASGETVREYSAKSERDETLDSIESQSLLALNSPTTEDFNTFPIALRGRASSTRSREGTLYAASNFRAQVRSDGRLSACPSFSTTAAATLSPHSASGTPTTAHSATAGCSRRTSSISSVDTL